MLKVSTNFNSKFSLELKRAERTTMRFGEILEPRNVKKWWPEIREKLRNMLLDNLDEIHKVPVSPRTIKNKKKMLQNPLGNKFTRKNAGPELPIISSDNWMVTGSMKYGVGSDVSGDRAIPKFRSKEITMSIGADTNDFVKDEEFDIPYPEAVDMKLMERSGNSIGMVRLNDMQISRILELLVEKNENLADRIFRGVRF